MHEVVAEIPFFPSMSMQFVTNFILGVSFVSKMNTCFRFKYHVSWLGSNVTFSKVMIQSIFLYNSIKNSITNYVITNLFEVMGSMIVCLICSLSFLMFLVVDDSSNSINNDFFVRLHWYARSLNACQPKFYDP